MPPWTSDADRYAAAWNTLIARRRWFGTFLIGSVPLNLLVLAIVIALRELTDFSRVSAERLFYAGALASLGAIVVSSIRLGLVKCPRCGKSFTNSWRRRNQLAAKCVHCGLPEGSSGP